MKLESKAINAQLFSKWSPDLCFNLEEEEDHSKHNGHRNPLQNQSLKLRFISR